MMCAQEQAPRHEDSARQVAPLSMPAAQRTSAQQGCSLQEMLRSPAMPAVPGVLARSSLRTAVGWGSPLLDAGSGQRDKAGESEGPPRLSAPVRAAGGCGSTVGRPAMRHKKEAVRRINIAMLEEGGFFDMPIQVCQSFLHPQPPCWHVHQSAVDNSVGGHALLPLNGCSANLWLLLGSLMISTAKCAGGCGWAGGQCGNPKKHLSCQWYQALALPQAQRHAEAAWQVTRRRQRTVR